ncbi:MAG TPA: proline--tRNA ligase, partial [Candidatus Bathyarchaeia archaeon]|nr:proline--tRNA ligase [Candidatus Bathyarchaeia archaeon]
ARIKATGHENASFPLFIPESFLKKEHEHVEGFAPELAIVTHAGGKKLDEPLVVRPTSETIIHHMFAQWMKSWRDLPIKINQWANVVRWEMRPRPFLRTTEFFWQEGHTAHETHQEAHDEVILMLNEYVKLATEYLAIPVVVGRKTTHEKFPGADITMTFEALMQDGKALQMGTSHLLSQSFAHAFDMKFQDRNEKIAYPYLTSWGATTRLIGAIIMTHGDAAGLIMPPRIAPIQIVIIPILKKGTDSAETLAHARRLEVTCQQANLRVFCDADELKTPGAKFYQWELKGVPLRVEIGPRDIAQGTCIVANRLTKEKTMVSLDGASSVLQQMLDDFHTQLFNRASATRNAQWYQVDDLQTFGPQLEEKNGFYQTGWCGDHACELVLKEYKATIRCIMDVAHHATCFSCKKPSSHDIVIAKAY